MTNKATGIGIALAVVMVGATVYAQQNETDLRAGDQTHTGTYNDQTHSGTYSRHHDGTDFYRGDRTFSISGSGSSDKKFDSNTGSMDLELGIFVADELSFAVRQGMQFANMDEGKSDWNGSTRLGLDWFFLDLRRVEPYVGVNIGYIYGDGVKDQFIAGPDAGIRVFVNHTTYVRIGVEYQFLFEDSDDVDETYKDGRFVYGLGMGVKF